MADHQTRGIGDQQDLYRYHYHSLLHVLDQQLPTFSVDRVCNSCHTFYTHVAHDSCKDVQNLQNMVTALLFTCFVMCTRYVMLVPCLISDSCVHVVNACQALYYVYAALITRCHAWL